MNGTLSGAGGTFTLNGGVMEGPGTVNGNLTIGGSATVRLLGNTTLTVTGNLTQNGTLEFRYDNGWGTLTVIGTAALNSTLSFVIEQGDPGMGWRDVLTASDITYNNPNPVIGFDWQIVAAGAGKKLQVKKLQ